MVQRGIFRSRLRAVIAFNKELRLTMALSMYLAAALFFAPAANPALPSLLWGIRNDAQPRRERQQRRQQHEHAVRVAAQADGGVLARGQHGVSPRHTERGEVDTDVTYNRYSRTVPLFIVHNTRQKEREAQTFENVRKGRGSAAAAA